MIPQASIPAGTLNKVGNPLTKTYDPRDQDIIDNAHKSSLKIDQQSLFANRQVYVGVILRVDNNYLVDNPVSQSRSDGSLGQVLVKIPFGACNSGI